MKFVLLALVIAASAYGAANVCTTSTATGAGVDFGDKPACPDNTGATAATAACLCGKNSQAVAKDEFCFVKADGTGVMSANKAEACTGGTADGSTAAPTDGCYCGTTGTLLKADSAQKFCDIALAAAGTAFTTKKCAKTDGSAANALGAACSCGTNNLQVPNTEFCFVKGDKTAVKSAKKAEACTGGTADGSTAAPTDGCYCGTTGTLLKADSAKKFCDTALAAAGTALTTKKCANEDGSAANALGAACSCGTNDIQVPNGEFCFVKADKTGVKSATKACGVTASNGLVKAGAACACGTGAVAVDKDHYCCGGLAVPTAAPTKAPTAPTKAPTKAAAGGATAAITVKQEVKFGIAAADYKTDVKTLVERSYGLATKICTGNCTAWSTGYSLASAAARRASCTVTFTTTCADKTKSAAAATAAKAITKDTMKTQMTTLKTQAGLAGTVPTVSSVAAPKDSAAVVAAASTDGVNAGLAFTALCLAVTALRQ